MTNPLLLAGCGVGGLVTGVVLNGVVRRHGASPDEDRPLGPPWSDDGWRSPPGSVVMALGTGGLWVLAGWRAGVSLLLPPLLLLFGGLLVLSAIDLRTYRLPNRLTLPLLVVSVPLLVAVSLARGEPRHLAGAAIGAAGLFAFLAALASISPRGLGWGDVKLGAVLGLYLGWIGPLLVVYALLIAGVAGVVVGLAVLVVRRRNAPYPFGPWLALGAVVALLASHGLLHP